MKKYTATIRKTKPHILWFITCSNCQESFVLTEQKEVEEIKYCINCGVYFSSNTKINFE